MSIQNEEIAEIVRKYIAAWHTKDIDSIVTLGADIKGGFGWRASAWRDRPYVAERVANFFDTFKYYGIELTEIHTWSEGDVGIAWGIYTESFQQKEQPPEKARARFTFTYRKDSQGWHELMYHRDIQPFNEDGQYPIELTQVK